MNWLTKLSINQNISLSPEENKLISFLRTVAESHPLKPTVRLVGGWVRDKLLGVPSKDYDVTVDKLTGEAFGKFIVEYDQAKGLKAVSRLNTTESRPDQIKNLAVSFISIFGNPVEILSLRKEEYDPGNRNPRVTSGTPEEDALRRDLTINSLFYNVNTGQIEDFTGKGISDIKSMTLRTPLDPIKTFSDDPLRVLRVLRFHSRYPQSSIDPAAVNAMKNEQIQNLITKRLWNPSEQMGIVAERTAEELRKIMKSKNPANALRTMYEVGLLQKLMNLPPSFQPLNMDQRNKHHTMSVIDHTLSVLENVNKQALAEGMSDDERMKLNFAAIVHDIGKLDPRSHKHKPDNSLGFSGDPTREDALTHEQSSGEQWNSLANALQLSNSEREDIHDIVVNHMAPHAHVEGVASDKALRRYLRNNPQWRLHYMHAIGDLLSKGRNLDPSELQSYKELYQKLSEMPQVAPQGHGMKATDLLNGQEIISLVGPDFAVKPPKGEIGYIEVIKERIREEQDANPNLTKANAQEIVGQMIANGELDRYRINRIASWLTRLIK